MRAIILLCGACWVAATAVNAQTGQLPLTSGAGYQPQSVLPSPFRCANFARNRDGSWSPLRPVTIRSGDTKATLQPGVTFSAGTNFAGVDVAAQLNRQCIAH
jgi:hypothetical protein